MTRIASYFKLVTRDNLFCLNILQMKKLNSLGNRPEIRVKCDRKCDICDTGKSGSMLINMRRVPEKVSLGFISVALRVFTFFKFCIYLLHYIKLVRKSDLY